MLPGISMYYFTFECLMVQNVAWNQYVICIILLLTGISMYYYTFDCLMVENVAWNQYVLFYF